MKILIALLIGSATPALTENFEPLTAAQITESLTDRKLQYENAWQDFRASGRTLYNAGRDSWGYWAVRGDQYCSSWPPGDQWNCYNMARSGDTLRFIAPDGSYTDGVYAE